MAIVYKGWIPTVSGKLSFSLIGESAGNSVAVSVNRADAQDRYVISYQNRFLSDSVMPRCLSGVFNSGSFNFVCIGKSSNEISVENDKLSGSLLIFNDNDDWNGAEIWIRHNQSRLASIDVSANKLSAKFESFFNFLINDLQQAAAFWVNFTLARNGFVEIIIDETCNHGADKIKYPSNLVEKKRIEDTQAAQCFYFLRDMIHKHQHHSPSTDTILDLYRSSVDDNQWICESLRVLYRKILDFKRLRKDEVYCSSIGLLTYAKSLRKISRDTFGDMAIICPGLEIADDLLEESIKAVQTATNNSTQFMLRRSDVIRTTMLGILGLLLAVTNVFKLTDIPIPLQYGKDAIMYKSATWLINYPHLAISVVLLVTFLFMCASGVVNFTKVRFLPVRGMYRSMQSFHKVWHALAWLLVGGAALVVCYFIIDPTVSFPKQ